MRGLSAAQSPDLDQLGATVRDRRKQLNVTQAQLAARLGWSQERVSVLETGKYGLPSLPLLAHLAEAIELPLSSLMAAVGFSVEERAAVEMPAGNERVGAGLEAVLRYTLQRLLGLEALTLRDAMNGASDLMAQAMGADKIDLFLHEPESAMLVTQGTSNTSVGRQQVRVGLDRVPIADGGRQVQVYLTGEEFYTGQADTDPEISRGIIHTLGIRSLYAVPFRVSGRVRGILVAESIHPDRFSAVERDFFVAAAQWIGMVAHRAELHEELTRRAATETQRLVAEEMLETVAHDLGNQITPIKGQIDLLLRRMKRDGSSGLVVEMEQVAGSLNRLNRMVHDLLDTSRLEGGIFSLRRAPVNVVDIVREVVDEARLERPAVDSRTPDRLMVEADPARLMQALLNLMSNALQHTPPDTPVTVGAGVLRRDDGDWVRIEVHDEGPGVGAEVLPRLFTRHAAAGERAGLGLGLYLARGIAAAHGGELVVNTDPGSGTTFTLTLPAQRDAPL